MSDDHIEFHLFNVNTRRLLPSHRVCSSIEVVERQADNLGDGEDEGNLSWVLGHYKNPDLLYVDRNGQVRRIPRDGVVPPADLPPYE